MSDKEIIEVVGAAIIDEDGRILSARRGPDMKLAGQWEFPGGKIEEGESARACLSREIREELGIEVEVGEAVATGYAAAGPGRTVRLEVYRCRWVRGKIELVEHDQIVWLEPSQLDSLEWAEADLPAVEVLSNS